MLCDLTDSKQDAVSHESGVSLIILGCSLSKLSKVVTRDGIKAP